MRRPRLRRSIPHGLLALSLVAVTLLGAFAIAPSEVVADTPGGQASIYNGIAQSTNFCGGLDIPFFQGANVLLGGSSLTISSRLHIFNARSTQVTLTLRATPNAGSSSGTFATAVAVPARTEAIVNSFDPIWTPGTTPGTTVQPLPTGFQGTVRAFGCENTRLVASVEFGSASGTLPTTTPTVTTTTTATPLPTSTLVPTPTNRPTSTTVPTTIPQIGELNPVLGPSSDYLYKPMDQITFNLAFRLPASGCQVATPLFMNNRDGMTSTMVVRNESENTAGIEVRAVGLGGGALTTRTFDISAFGSTTISASQLGVADGFAGSVIVDACPPRPNPADLSAVVMHNSTTGDSTAVEMQNVVSSASNDLFVPEAHNDDNGMNSQVIIQNTHPDSELTVRLEVHPDGGQPEIDRSITVRSESAAVVDLASLPKGAMSIKVEGPRGALQSTLLAGAYHMGTGGMAAAGNAFNTAASGNRMEMPLIFRAAGLGGGYESNVRVMKAGPGAITPRITLRDRDTNDRIGPITAKRSDGSDVTLREDEAYTWNVAGIAGLQAGHYYSAEADDESGGQLVASATYINAGRNTGGTYSAIDRGSGASVYTAPVVMKNVDALQSGIEIQDLAGREQSITVRFVNNRGGRQEGATVTQNVAENGSATIYLPTEASVPDGTWTAEITATDRIAVVINTVRYR